MARERKRHVRDPEGAVQAAVPLAPMASPPCPAIGRPLDAPEARLQYLDFIRVLARGMAQRDHDAEQA